MKKNTKRCRGAVSVFLTLVLVPCIIITCAFGDVSRVQLSRAGAASAADLALYSLMADYDVDLKEYYGLVASCQNIDEFYAKTATYFSGMMDAKGVSGEGSELFTEYLKSLLKSGDGKGAVADFLQVEITEVAEVSAAANAQLGENPALIEDGIVEFMKYRGPVSLVTRVIDRFTSLNLGKDTADVDKNNEIVKKKQEYAEAEGELLSAALFSYIAIHEYEEAWKADNPLAEKGYAGLSEDLSCIWKDLRPATELVTKYYFADTDNLVGIEFPVYNKLDIYSSRFTVEKVGTKVQLEDGSQIYCVNFQKLQELTDGVKEAVSAVEHAVNAVQGSFPRLVGNDNPAVYMLEVEQWFYEQSEWDTIKQNMKLLLEKYAQMQAAMQCVPFPEGDDLPQQWQEELNRVCTSIKKLQRSLSDSGSSTYIQCVHEYQSCASYHLPKIKNRAYTFKSSYTKNAETLGSFISQASSRLPMLRSQLQELIHKLTTAVNGGKVKINGRTEKVVSLDELVEKAEAYHNTRQQWGATADRYQDQTEYAQQESAAYHGTSTSDGESEMSKEERRSEEMASKITKEAVQELKQRLSNILSDMQDILHALDQFTYGGSRVEDIQSADTLISLARSVMPARSERSLSQNEKDAAAYFSSLIHPDSDRVWKAAAIKDGVKGNNPDLSRSTPGLYAFFKDKFKQEDISKIEKKKKESEEKMQQYQEQAEAEQEKAQGVENDILEGKGGDISGGHGGDEVTLGTAVSSIVGIVNNILTGEGDELRDQLYVCEYIMDMFSYASFNNEGKYKRAVNGENKNYKNKTIKPKDVPLKDEKWDTDEKTKIPANQSLTNRAINQANNQSNLGEVEYILYGKETIDQNLNASYGNIFVLRGALNLVSGFVNFYNSSKNNTAAAIHASAVAISAATCGVVPVSVTKCTLIAVLAALETADDLNRLKRGFPTDFYKKTDKDWTCALPKNSSGSGGSASGSSNKPNKKDGMYYSDYMYLFLITGLTSDYTGLYSSMLLRVGDLIEANMRKAGQNDYDLSKAVCYFHLTAQMRVKPLMLTLPIVNAMDGVDPSGLLENKDWCTYGIDIYRGYS